MQKYGILIYLLASLFAFNLKANEDLNYMSIDSYALSEYQEKNQISFDGQTSLYDQIAKEFHLQYESIGKREALKVLNSKNLSITGGLNSIGFSYNHPFVSFGVTVDRNLAPDLFDDKRWIVTDTFNVEIDASKLIGTLEKEGIVDITEENKAAFVGVVFKRKFTWVHFAPSYEEGLMRDFHKLFMPFKATDISNLRNLKTEEMIFKEDLISFKAGGLVSAPIYTGISVASGVLAKFEKLAKVEVIGLEGDLFQINSEKSKMASVGINIGIQADFLNLLRMTLLSYDFSYELESSYKVYLNIPKSRLVYQNDQDPIRVEVEQILKNREGDLDVLSPFLISEEKRVSQTLNHKYNFLLLGAHKKSKTQQIEIAKEGKVKNFFRHYYERIKYTESLVSRLFASLLYALTNYDISATKLASDTQNVTLEYDSERNLIENYGTLNIEKKVENKQKLSLTFKSDFKTQRSKGSGGKKYRERAVFLLERYSGVDPLAISMIENEHLVAPFHIEGKYQVDIGGVRYLNHLSVGDVFHYAEGLCDEYPRNRFFNFRNLFDTCKKNLQDDYINYLKDLTHNKVTLSNIDYCHRKSIKYFLRPAKKRAFIKDCLSRLNKLPEEEWVEVPMWQLKKLVSNVVNNSYSKVHYYNLFGVHNVFFFGTFKANTSDGRGFTTHFHEGEFKGLGAVDHYMRVENIRAPAAVIVDQ